MKVWLHGKRKAKLCEAQNRTEEEKRNAEENRGEGD